MKETTIKVLFVCLGNICRSPTAEAILRQRVEDQGLFDQIKVDSAGTGNYHIGDSPDSRAVNCASTKGVQMQHLKARQIEKHDFESFDYIFTMDQNNLINTLKLAPNHQQKVHLFLDFVYQTLNKEVPDPYFGGNQGFAEVFDLLDKACIELLNVLKAKHAKLNESL